MGVLSKGWRLFATGLCFLVFGLGGLLLSWLIIPVVYLFTANRLQSERRVKILIHYTFRFFVCFMSICGVLTYKIHKRELQNISGQLILANHPSLIDVVFLIAFIRRADCIVKSSLLRNPFTMGAMRMAGYIANENPERVIELASESMKKGNSLIIFPEGTRTTPGKPLSMRRGAANIVLRTDCEVTPVLIRCKPVALTKGHKWYQIPDRRIHITLNFRPNLNVNVFRGELAYSLAARKLTHYLEHYFIQELVLHE